MHDLSHRLSARFTAHGGGDCISTEGMETAKMDSRGASVVVADMGETRNGWLGGAGKGTPLGPLLLHPVPGSGAESPASDGRRQRTPSYSGTDSLNLCFAKAKLFLAKS